MSNDNTWFDAFFNAVTSSKEFKGVAEKDWAWDFQKGLKNMEKEIKKASEITSSFKDTFATPEAIEVWTNYKPSNKPYINKTEDKEDKPNPINIQYFENKNPDTFGFAWVAGMEELKTNLRENFIKPLKFKFLVEKLEKEAWETTEKEAMFKQIHEAYKKFNVGIPTGMLFYGPPGTGKTFLTKKLAQELWAWLIKKSVWEFGSSYIHATSKNIRDFFTQAKEASEKWPIILFLDEIDSLVSKRTNNVDSNKAEEVSQFLQEFNALDEAPNLIVIAATNRPDHLDSAILRSGRLDKKIYLWPPDFKARKELFQIFIEKEKRPHKDLDYKHLAELTEWYVAADLEAIVDEVARDASQSILNLANNIDNIDPTKLKEKLANSVITMQLLEKAISETTPSTKFVDMSIFEEWINQDKKEQDKKIRI
jgi:transitional endoplasmic reticulum ATPase